MTDTDTETDVTTRTESIFSRRRLLSATGAMALAGIAGCSRSDSSGSDACEPPSDLSGPVPDVYEGAMAQGGRPRPSSGFISKSKADYQREPNGSQQCSKCAYYVPDQNGDCAGACYRVEGLIVPSGYCEYYRTNVGGGW